MAITKKDIQKFIKEKGYEIESLEDKDRSFICKLVKKNKDFYLKIATNSKEGYKLRNSSTFNEVISKLNPPFEIPKVIDSGLINNEYFYKIENSIKGQVISTMEKGISTIQIPNVEKYFPLIIKSALWIQKQEIVLPNTLTRKFDRSSKELMLTKMIEWSYPDTPCLSEFLKIVSQFLPENFETHIAHGDFTCINLLITDKGGLGVIDTDLTDSNKLKYYDIIEFYNRLWSRDCSIELAKKFLRAALKNKEIKKDKEIFLRNLYILGAYRTFGNYYEYKITKDADPKRLKFIKSFAGHIYTQEFLL